MSLSIITRSRPEGRRRKGGIGEVHHPLDCFAEEQHSVVDEVLHGRTAQRKDSVIGTEKLTLSVDETAKLLGISRTLAFEEVRKGTITSIRLGRRILVPRQAIERMIADAVNGGHGQ